MHKSKSTDFCCGLPFYEGKYHQGGRCPTNAEKAKKLKGYIEEVFSMAKPYYETL